MTYKYYTITKYKDLLQEEPHIIDFRFNGVHYLELCTKIACHVLIGRTPPHITGL